MNEFIGIPFKARGRDFSGVDCWGIVVLFYKHKLGIELPSHAEEYSDIDSERKECELLIKADAEEFWTSVPKPKFGDVVVCSRGIYNTHLGIVVSKDSMLHIHDTLAGSCIERFTDYKWKNRIRSFYRHAEMLHK